MGELLFMCVVGIKTVVQWSKIGEYLIVCNGMCVNVNTYMIEGHIMYIYISHTDITFNKESPIK